MDLGPNSPNNEFVENGLENQVLINQTNLRMDSDLERKRKKRVCVGVNCSWQDPRRSVLIYCFSVQLQISSSPIPVFLFPFYTLLLSRSYFTRVYWRVGVGTYLICTFHQSPCSSCKAETHCSCITSTLMQPESCERLRPRPPFLQDVGPNPREWVESCYCLSKWRFD